MRTWNRRGFVRLLPGAVGGVLLPGLSVSVLTSCSSDADRETRSGPIAADMPPRTVALRTQGGAFRFDPGGLWLEPDSSLTWLNMGDFHTTTAFHPANSELVGGPLPLRIPEGAEPWHSGMLGLDAGTQYERRFVMEGVYDYLCQPHYGFGMVGRLVVGRRGPEQTYASSELPAPAREHMPSMEMIVGPRGRTFEWASRINGVLLLLANAQPAVAAARAVVLGAGADERLSAVLKGASSQRAFTEALDAFAEGVERDVRYETLVVLADAAKDILDRARSHGS